MKQMAHKTVTIALMLLAAVHISAAAVTVTIDDYTSAPGGEVVVPVRINGVTNYGTGTINITYDPAVVQVAGVSDGDDSTVTASSINNTAGITSIAAWNTGGVSGDIVFANVALKAVGSGEESSPLTLTVAKLADTSMKSISAGQSGGVFATSGSYEGAAPGPGSTGQSAEQSPLHLTPPLPHVVGEPADPGADDSLESPPSQSSSRAEDADAAGTTDTGDDTEPHRVQTPSQKIPGPGVVSISLSILLVYLILTQNTKRGGGR